MFIKKLSKKKLFSQFSNLLVTYPLDRGSFAKKTAIASNYDLDIVLAFRKNSYASLEEMYNDVYYKLNQIYGHRAIIRKHSKAISISLELKTGDFISLDIVPGREIDDFQKDNDLNLYVRPDWVWQRGSSFKTNYSQQRNIATNKPDARNTIKLIKIYKERNKLELPATIIEQCVVEALSGNKFGVHPSITENLLNAMDHLSRRLNQTTFTDYSNTNNNLNSKMTQFDRNFLSNLLQKDIKKIEKSPRYTKEIFG